MISPFADLRYEQAMGDGNTVGEGAAALQGPAKPVRRGRPPLGRSTQRKRILNAASRLFLRNRFEKTSLDAIAREAGVTKRTIYELVGDKSALFREVCRYYSASISHDPFRHPTPGMQVDDALTDLARALLAHALDPSLIALSRMIMLESMRFPELVRTILEAGREVVHGKIIAVFTAIERHGIAIVVDHEFAAELFYDIVVGNQGFRATIGFDEHAQSDVAMRRRLEVFIRGYIRPSAD